jgi:hypothetical protein
LATAVLMTVFVLTSLTPSRALAADATRDGDSVTYDGHTFAPMADNQRPSGIQSDVTGYVSLDETNKKAYFILTTGEVAKATTGQYVIYDFTPPANFSNPSPPVTVSIADAPSDTESSGSTDETSSGCSSNVLQGIGWILCPVVNFLATCMDGLFNILSGFLVVQPARATEDSSLFKMWGMVRSIANICFVIAFLIVIYSQVTSIGISTYGIKKILPRLAIAAILVNVSFWICALAIDLSNTLGFGIHSLFTGVMGSLNNSEAYQNLTWSNVAVSVLSGTAVAALGAYGIYGALVNLPGLLITLIPTLVGVLLSVLVALLVISVRQALITCLVIISPLAFVAFLLPNTEKYFTKWRELFLTLLLVYPIFAVVFGGAQLAGMAIIQNAGGALNLIILGMAVQIAPVVITPLLIKVSGSLVGKIAGLVNNPRQGVMNKTRTWAEGRAAERKARVLSDANRNGWLIRRSRAINDYNTGHEQMRKEYEARDGHRFARTARGRQVERLRRQNINAGKRVTNAHDLEFEALEIESRHLDVTKSNIETNMMNTQAGRELRRRQSNSEAYKTESENAFNRTEGGRQARARRERAEIDKTDTDIRYSQSTIGQQVDHARRVVESRKKLAEGEQSERFADSADGKMYELEIRRHDAREAARKATADRHYAELVSGHATDGHFGNFASDAALRVRGTTISSELQETQLKVSLDGMAKRNADIELQKNIAHSIEAVAVHPSLGGLSAREYAAGVGGVEGQASALASAQSTLREQFGKLSAEYEELRNQYMPPIGDIKDFLRGSDASGRPVNSLEFKDEHGHTVLAVDGSNTAAMNAMAKHITTVGIVDEVSEMLQLSGRGQRLYEYRETIADALARRGVAGRSIFEGGQMIELVRQGQVGSESDLFEYIQTQIDGGKVAANDLSVMDAKAIKRFISSIKRNRRSGTNDAGATIGTLSPQYRQKVARLIENAHIALTDPRISVNVKDVARGELEVLDRLYASLPTDAAGNVDYTAISLADIQRHIPHRYL